MESGIGTSVNPDNTVNLMISNKDRWYCMHNFIHQIVMQKENDERQDRPSTNIKYCTVGRRPKLRV